MTKPLTPKQLDKRLREFDKYHKTYHGKPVAINLPKPKKTKPLKITKTEQAFFDCIFEQIEKLDNGL